MAEHGSGLWEKWRAIVSEQVASGQSVAAFCKELGVASSQVFAWKKRLREAEKAQFVEGQIKPAEPLREIGIRQQAEAIEFVMPVSHSRPPGEQAAGEQAYSSTPVIAVFDNLLPDTT